MKEIEALQSFLAVLETEPPSSATLFELVRGLGWSIEAYPDGKASLRLKNASDPLAHKIVKMLKQEPWRSEVLKIATTPMKMLEPVPELCPKCGATVNLGSGITRADIAACCRGDRGEMHCPYESGR